MTTNVATTQQAAIVPVVGFTVKQFTAFAPKEKDEDSVGKIRVVLEAESQDIRAQGKELAEILGALNVHRMTREPTAMQLRF